MSSSIVRNPSYTGSLIILRLLVITRIENAFPASLLPPDEKRFWRCGLCQDSQTIKQSDNQQSYQQLSILTPTLTSIFTFHCDMVDSTNSVWVSRPFGTRFPDAWVPRDCAIYDVAPIRSRHRTLLVPCYQESHPFGVIYHKRVIFYSHEVASAR